MLPLFSKMIYISSIESSPSFQDFIIDIEAEEMILSNGNRKRLILSFSSLDVHELIVLSTRRKQNR